MMDMLFYMGCVLLGFIGGVLCTAGVYEMLWRRSGAKLPEQEI